MNLCSRKEPSALRRIDRSPSSGTNSESASPAAQQQRAKAQTKSNSRYPVSEANSATTTSATPTAEPATFLYRDHAITWDTDTDTGASPAKTTVEKSAAPQGTATVNSSLDMSTIEFFEKKVAKKQMSVRVELDEFEELERQVDATSQTLVQAQEASLPVRLSGSLYLSPPPPPPQPTAARIDEDHTAPHSSTRRALWSDSRSSTTSSTTIGIGVGTGIAQESLSKSRELARVNSKESPFVQNRRERHAVTSDIPHHHRDDRDAQPDDDNDDAYEDHNEYGDDGDGDGDHSKRMPLLHQPKQFAISGENDDDDYDDGDMPLPSSSSSSRSSMTMMKRTMAERQSQSQSQSERESGDAAVIGGGKGATIVGRSADGRPVFKAAAQAPVNRSLQPQQQRQHVEAKAKAAEVSKEQEQQRRAVDDELQRKCRELQEEIDTYKYVSLSSSFVIVIVIVIVICHHVYDAMQ